MPLAGAFATAVQLRSAGFEIETELASEAVARRLRVVEIPIPYHPRIAGTESKLRAFRDGRRILVTIVIQSLRLRPHRLLLAQPRAVPQYSRLTVHWAFRGLDPASAGFALLRSRRVSISRHDL